MSTEKNLNLIIFRIASILTSGRFEKFYNEFVVEKQLNENDEEFLLEVHKQFDCVFRNEGDELILVREGYNGNRTLYFSESGNWVESIHQAKVFEPEEKELLVSLQNCFGQLFDDVLVGNRW